jgi:sugar lactone lactonase YvrE
VSVVHGKPGPLRTLQLSGPAAGPSGTFFQNGIASTPDGKTLLVAPTPLGKVCIVNPVTGVSTAIEGVEVSQADGLELDGRRLWVVQTFANKITKWRLSGDFSRGASAGEITDPEFHVPLSAAKFGDRLAVVNSHLDTGYPPTSPTYEVVVVHS